MNAANVLTQRWPAPSTECFLSTTERRVPPRDATPGQGDLAERSSNTRFALASTRQSGHAAILRALDVPAELPITRAAFRDTDVSSATAVRVEVSGDVVRIVGSIPRSLASPLAVSDGALPDGDPVVISFTLSARDRSVALEGAYFHSFGRGGERRERVYAFAESRSVNQVLATLLAGLSEQALSRSPVLVRAHAGLRDIAAFEEGPEPAAGASRVIHRAARLPRTATYSIARTLGPIYDCGLEPRTPSMVDEPRELAVAQALVGAALAARNLDPALLYAVASDDGLQQEAESWRRGIAGFDIPSRIDGTRVLGLGAIADELEALRREGYLPSWFAAAVRGETSHPVFVSAGARSALTNALTFTAARLAYSRDRASDALARLNPRPDVDQRALVFLTLLHAEGGDVGVQRYLQARGRRPMLPTADEVRGDGAMVRAFARTAMWEQMSRTGVFERAP